MSHRAAGSSAGTGGPVSQVTAKTDKGLPVPQVNRTGYIGGLNRVTALRPIRRTTQWQAAPRFRGAGSRASLKRV
eukprot:scaffold4424_cov74-Phaeocystis_antarctica.AAC.1